MAQEEKKHAPAQPEGARSLCLPCCCWWFGKAHPVGVGAAGAAAVPSTAAQRQLGAGTERGRMLPGDRQTPGHEGMSQER